MRKGGTWKHVSIGKRISKTGSSQLGGTRAKIQKVFARLSEDKLADELPETGAKQTLNIQGCMLGCVA